MFRTNASSLATSLAIAACSILPASALAQTAAAANPLTGVVYVETNNSTPGGNAVLAFRRGAAGRLSQLGPTYLTGGTGTRDLAFSLATFANDQPVITNTAHTLLFAVNEGSNTVAVFHITPEGTLTTVAGSPFPSGGYQPVSLGLVGDVLTVANKNADPAQAAAEATAKPNYTTFRVLPGGDILPGPVATVISTGSPSQALAVRQSNYSDLSAFGYDRGQGATKLGFVFGADFAGGALQSLEVASSGAVRANAPLPLPANLFVGQTFQGGPAPAAPLGLQVHPYLPLLYVGFVTINKIGVYTFAPNGALNFVDAVDNPAPTNCWLLINKAATRMYAVDTGANEVTTFDIATDPLAPKALSVTQLTGTGTGFGFELALSPDDRYLYVISQQAAAAGSLIDNSLHVLQVSDDGNTLTEIQTEFLANFVKTVPAGTRWQGVVAF